MSAAIDLSASVIRPRVARRRRLGQCAPTGRRRLTKSDAPDPAGASTDTSNRRRRRLAAFRKRAGLACESAKVCVDVQSIPRLGIRMQSAPSFASPTTPPETCRRCRRSFPNNSLQSCVIGPRQVAARVVSAEAGGAIAPAASYPGGRNGETATPAPAAPQGSVAKAPARPARPCRATASRSAGGAGAMTRELSRMSTYANRPTRAR